MSKFHDFEEDAWDELDKFYAENPDYVEPKKGEPDRTNVNDKRKVAKSRKNKSSKEDFDKDALFMEGEKEEYMENLVIEMNNEDGSVSHFEFIARLTDNGKDYVVLFPLENNPDNEAVCLRLEQDKDGYALFGNIESEEERERVEQQFRELMEDDPDAVENEGGGVQWQD